MNQTLLKTEASWSSVILLVQNNQYVSKVYPSEPQFTSDPQLIAKFRDMNEALTFLLKMGNEGHKIEAPVVKRLTTIVRITDEDRAKDLNPNYIKYVVTALRKIGPDDEKHRFYVSRKDDIFTTGIADAMYFDKKRHAQCFIDNNEEICEDPQIMIVGQYYAVDDDLSETPKRDSYTILDITAKPRIEKPIDQKMILTTRNDGRSVQTNPIIFDIYRKDHDIIKAARNAAAEFIPTQKG